MRWDFRRLLPGHGWRTLDGKTIVLDRGAVQFNYPRSWLVEVTPGSLALFDRRPPAHRSRLDVSYFRTPCIDWSELPVVDLVDHVTSKPRDNARCGPLREEVRRGIELAWREVCFHSAQPRERAYFRACVARHGGMHCLITYESHGSDAPLRDNVWDGVLETLVLDGRP